MRRIDVQNIRSHKNDKDAIAKVAMRHRQNMQDALEDTQSKHNNLFKMYAELKASSEREISELRAKNANLSSKMSEIFEIKSRNDDPSADAMKQRIVVLEDQLALSRSNFQSLSRHTRGLEQANFRLQHEVQAATKLLQTEKQQQNTELQQARKREQEYRELHEQAEITKLAMIKCLQQLELEKDAAQHMAHDLHYQSEHAPHELQALRVDAETIASYAISLEERLGEMQMQDEKIKRLEATLIDARQHRRRLETAFKELHLKHIDMEKTMRAVQQKLRSELQRKQAAIDELETKKAHLAAQVQQGRERESELLAKQRQREKEVQQLVEQHQRKEVEMAQRQREHEAEVLQRQRAEFQAKQDALQKIRQQEKLLLMRDREPELRAELARSAQQYEQVEHRIMGAFQTLRQQTETMNAQIATYGREAMTKLLKDGKLDRDGKLLSKDELSKLQLKEAREVLRRVESARLKKKKERTHTAHQ